MAIKLHAYKNGSESAKALRDALGIKMLLPAGKGKWKGKAGDVLINWGCSTPHPNLGGAQYVNTPVSVHAAANKLHTQRKFDGVPAMKPYTIPWTTSKEVAQQWMEEVVGKGQAQVVVARQKLTGNSGEGIVLCKIDEQDLVDAPLYTKYMPKKDEYRVHVFDGKIIDVQRKARKLDVAKEDVNWKVRNLDGGFIFARDGVVAPNEVLIAAVESVKALGLVHGAVDIGHGRHGTFVYEVNTACGLSGSTLVTYAKAFAEYLGIPEKDLNLTQEQLDNYVPMNQLNAVFELPEVAVEQEVAMAVAQEQDDLVVQRHPDIIAPLPEWGGDLHIAGIKPAPEVEPAPKGFGKNFEVEDIDLMDEDVEITFGNLKVLITRDNFMKVVEALK